MFFHATETSAAESEEKERYRANTGELKNLSYNYISLLCLRTRK